MSEFDEQAARAQGIEALSKTDIDDGGEQLSFKIGHLRGCRWQWEQDRAELEKVTAENRRLKAQRNEAQGERDEARAARDRLAGALQDAGFVLAGSVAIEGQSDEVLDRRVAALERVLDALSAYKSWKAGRT